MALSRQLAQKIVAVDGFPVELFRLIQLSQSEQSVKIALGMTLPSK
jgi:hypothetical protein